MEPVYIELTGKQEEALKPLFDEVNCRANSESRYAILAQPRQGGLTACYLIDTESARRIKEIAIASINAQKEEAERKARIDRLKGSLNVSRVTDGEKDHTLSFVHEGFRYAVTEVGKSLA